MFMHVLKPQLPAVFILKGYDHPTVSRAVKFKTPLYLFKWPENSYQIFMHITYEPILTREISCGTFS